MIMGNLELVLIVSGISVAALIYYAWFYLPACLHRWHRQSLRSFSRAIELRTHARFGNSEQIAQVALELGRQFGLSTRRLQRLELAVYLRDIGMVGVPYAILNKETSLTAIERMTFARHVEIGAAIVEQIPGLREVAPLVRFHHVEYATQPDAPVEAHLLAALSSLYEGLARGQAAETTQYLQQQSGQLYHPRVVQAILQHFGQLPVIDPMPVQRSAALWACTLLYPFENLLEFFIKFNRN
jgi:HD-GYP domain-containing protein (c-di-GMP phosphodiesterase class II)